MTVPAETINAIAIQPKAPANVRALADGEVIWLERRRDDGAWEKIANRVNEGESTVTWNGYELTVWW